MIDWRIEADSFGSCSCEHWCPCQFEGDPSHGYCEAIEGFRINRGHYGDVDLAGVTGVVLYAFPGPVYKGGGTMQTIVAEGATQAQVDAVTRISQGQDTVEGSNIWWVYHAMSDTVLETLVRPITFEMDIESRTGLIEVPGLVRCQGEPIRNPHDGGEHRVQLRMPGGVEFEVADIGNANAEVTADVPIRKMENTYAQFNTIDFTGEGPAHNR